MEWLMWLSLDVDKGVVDNELQILRANLKSRWFQEEILKGTHKRRAAKIIITIIFFLAAFVTSI
jgi:hypothetical protein